MEMNYHPLGRTGVAISPLVLGTASLGPWGNADEAEVKRIVDRALDAGINAIDTAEEYSRGATEEMLGRILTPAKRQNVILSTKFYFRRSQGPNSAGNSRRRIFQAVEASLRRLNTDWIDVYFAHRPDPICDVDETLGAMTDLVRQGKIRYLGSSNFAAHSVVEAQWVAEKRARERFVCEQPPYSILVRGAETAVLPVCEQYRMGAITWSPLAGGWLTGKYHKGMERTESSRRERLARLYDLSDPANQRKLDAVEALTVLAEQAGMTLIEMALAFAASHRAVSAILIGPRTLDQLEIQLASVGRVLDDDVLRRIDEIVPPGVTISAADSGWTPPELGDSLSQRGRDTGPFRLL